MPGPLPVNPYRILYKLIPEREKGNPRKTDISPSYTTVLAIYASPLSLQQT